MPSFRRSSLGPLAVAMSLALLLGFGLARGIQATDDLRGQLDLFSQVLYLVQNNYVDVPDNQKQFIEINALWYKDKPAARAKVPSA